MNVHSYIIIHYGRDYLGYALRSIYPCVDQIHVIYTPHPSHGYQPDIPPIESKEQIQQSIPAEVFDKVHWYEMQGVYQEGQQRDAALKICQDAGADIVLVVDCDEVWSKEALENALIFVDAHHQHKPARNFLVNMVHLWRSFNWCCRDLNWPVRLIDLTVNESSIACAKAFEVVYVPTDIGRVYHFGYATRDELMRYKWQIHGHKGELRSGWLENEWQAWPPVENCHPTNDRNNEGIGFWNPEPFDKQQLPALMREHPFWDLERIE